MCILRNKFSSPFFFVKGWIPTCMMLVDYSSVYIHYDRVISFILRHNSFLAVIFFFHFLEEINTISRDSQLIYSAHLKSLRSICWCSQNPPPFPGSVFSYSFMPRWCQSYQHSFFPVRSFWYIVPSRKEAVVTTSSPFLSSVGSRSYITLLQIQ